MASALTLPLLAEEPDRYAELLVALDLLLLLILDLPLLVLVRVFDLPYTPVLDLPRYAL